MIEDVAAVIIVYLAPFFVYLSKPFLVKHDDLISSRKVLLLVLATASFLSLVIKPYWVFPMYAGMFVVVHGLTLSYTKSKTQYSRGDLRFLAFSLGAYVVYAIAQLWEWPYELTQPIGTPILYAILQLVPIAFFFKAVRSYGFKATSSYLKWVLVAVGYGVALTTELYFIGVENQQLYYALHLYRLVWLTVFVRALQITFSEKKAKDELQVPEIPDSD